MAKIVHGADVAEDRDTVAEAAGLDAIAHGFAMVHGTDDHKKLDVETPMYDAVYECCRRQAQ